MILGRETNDCYEKAPARELVSSPATYTVLIEINWKGADEKSLV